MLSSFPIELVEEILLNLPTRDLISTINVNRRLYAIVHSQKTPVRHRLVERTSNIELCLSSSDRGYTKFDDHENDVSILKIFFERLESREIKQWDRLNSAIFYYILDGEIQNFICARY